MMSLHKSHSVKKTWHPDSERGIICIGRAKPVYGKIFRPNKSLNANRYDLFTIRGRNRVRLHVEHPGSRVAQLMAIIYTQMAILYSILLLQLPHVHARQLLLQYRSKMSTQDQLVHGNCSVITQSCSEMLMQSFRRSLCAGTEPKSTTSDGKQIIYHGLCTDRECCSWLLEVICSTQAHTTQTYQNE